MRRHIKRTRHTCAQLVKNLGIADGIIRGRTYTAIWPTAPTDPARRVKLVFIHQTIAQLFGGFPQVQLAYIPLSEHYLYPVSTAPITNTAKEIKER